MATHAAIDIGSAILGLGNGGRLLAAWAAADPDQRHRAQPAEGREVVCVGAEAGNAARAARSFQRLTGGAAGKALRYRSSRQPASIKMWMTSRGMR